MKCTIRKWTLSDADALAGILSNTNILDKLRDGIPYPYTKDDASEYINAMLSADDNNNFVFAVIKDGKVVGNIGASRGENIHRCSAELGYYLDERYWNQGIMTDAVKQICKYIFDTTDIIRIYAEPFAYNTGSCRVLQKSGFECEGLLRANAVKNGKTLDMKMYSLIKGE